MFISLIQCRALARRFLVFAGLATLSSSAAAGSYRVTYDTSACRTTVIGPSGEQWHESYWEQGGSILGGESSRDPDGPGPLPNTNLGPGSVSASGTIKATFTWVPAYSGEVPPQYVLVEEVAAAGWVGTSGTCADGLGGTPTESDYSGDSAETKYWLKSEPGESFTIPAAPSASAVRNNEYIQGLAGNGNAYVYYRASVAPLRLLLNGTTIVPVDGKSVDHCEVGQSIGGSFSVDDKMTAPSFDFRNQVAFENYLWGIGGHYFKAFYVDSLGNSGYVAKHEPSDRRDPGMRWCWNKGSPDPEDETVNCSADVYVFGTSAGRVSLTTKARLLDPTQVLYGGEGGTTYKPTSVIAFDEIPGMNMAGNADTHPIVSNAMGKGRWMFAQLATLDRHLWGSVASGHVRVVIPVLQLDGSWGYEPHVENAYVADNTTQATNDSPEWSTTGGIAYTVNDHFETYLMYKAPGDGSQWVPILTFTWEWKAQGTRLTPWSHWPTPIDASITCTQSKRVADHPEWTARIISPIIPEFGP